MRLSEVLSRAPSTEPKQVENFLGYRYLKRGVHRNIQTGVVFHDRYCIKCNGITPYLSPTTQKGDEKKGKTLSCLITGENSVSIDVTLQCSGCGTNSEEWFLVVGDNLFSQAPVVHIERYTENRRDLENSERASSIPDLFVRAEIAYNDHLGSGAMIYLRKIFEIITIESAKAANLPTQAKNNKRITFKDLLQEVDNKCHIIPPEFSNNGYTLFSELSNVIHGESDEQEALEKYVPCKTLVKGIISGIENSKSMKQATVVLGWSNVLSSVGILQS